MFLAKTDSPLYAQLMLERGADVNARDKYQEMPLHLASYKSTLQTVQVLRTMAPKSRHGIWTDRHHYTDFHRAQILSTLTIPPCFDRGTDKDRATPRISRLAT